MSNLLRCDHREDMAVIRAINDCDHLALADALRLGGARNGSAALKLLISATSRRAHDPFVILPKRTRGQKKDPLLRLATSLCGLDLRRGLAPSDREELIAALGNGMAYIRRQVGSRRGPRENRFHIPKLWLDGWGIEAELSKIAMEHAQQIASSAPKGSVIPVIQTRGMQAEAVRRFLANQPQIGMSGPDAKRYAMRALSTVRKLNLRENAETFATR